MVVIKFVALKILCKIGFIASCKTNLWRKFYELKKSDMYHYHYDLFSASYDKLNTNSNIYAPAKACSLCKGHKHQFHQIL